MRRSHFSRWGSLLILAAATLLFSVSVDARGRGGRGGGPQISRSGPASHGSVRRSGGGHREARGNRRDTGRDARGNRRDNRSERREFKRDVRSERREFVRDERHEYWEHRSRRRVGAILTATTFRSLSCRPMTVIIIDGVSYYSCDSVWYSRRYVRGSVTYVVVTAPAGYS